jgi:hypothetical protein
MSNYRFLKEGEVVKPTDERHRWDLGWMQVDVRDVGKEISVFNEREQAYRRLVSS